MKLLLYTAFHAAHDEVPLAFDINLPSGCWQCIIVYLLLKLCVLCTGIPLGQASVLLVAFISFFLVAAIFNGEYGDKAIDENRTY